MDFQQQSTFTSSLFEKIEKQNKKQNCKKIRLDEWTNKTCFDVLSFSAENDSAREVKVEP